MNETHGDLSRKVALVTGGSRGIGRAIALARADAGADVAINYLRRYDGADD
jgi:3-oxoacyl-[acyl-carrier protein] reductase